jgi:hypothetical protein
MILSSRESDPHRYTFQSATFSHTYPIQVLYPLNVVDLVVNHHRVKAFEGAVKPLPLSSRPVTLR